MGNKIITEKDFWICSEGNMPSQLQGTRLANKKKSGEVYITVEDKATCTSIDFGCKKYMLLMAIAAALTVVVLAVVGVLTVATGGAALIALGAVAGAVGAAVGGMVGGLLCGQKMHNGRKWTGYKKNFISQGSYTITGDSHMTCKAGGVVTFAPHIKSWSQAVALGSASFIGGVFEGMLAGAAIGMTGGAVSGGAGAVSAGGIRGLGKAGFNFAKSMPKNFYVNAIESVSKFGLTLRGVMGAQGAAQQFGETGEFGLDTASAAGKGIFGMEIGLYDSVGNVFSGKATWHDITGLALAFAPVGKGKRELEEALSNKEAEGKAKDSETTKDGEESTQKVKNQEGETKKQEGDGEAFEDPNLKIIEQRRTLAIDFYKKHNLDMSIDDIRSHINGIDFTKPVKIIKISNGTELFQYTKVNNEGISYKGDYYTDNPINTPNELGISDKYNVRKGREYTDVVKTVTQEKVIIGKNVEGLKSTSAEINDNWSLKDIEVHTDGGGSQIYIPKNQFK